MEFFSPFVEFGFMRRALVGCLALSLGGTPVGVFMLLRRMSLMGDAMSHAILPGAALGYLFFGLSLTAMTVGGLIAGLLVVLMAGFVTRSSRLKEEANLAAFYLISMALGVLIISLKGRNADLLQVLFGGVLALDDSALVLMAGIATVSVLSLAVLLRPLVLECADPAFLRSMGRSGEWAYYIFLMLVVMNLVAGFHAMGTLMAVGLMILPAIAARLWTQRLGMLLALASGLAVLSSVAGLLLSYHADLPAGAAIILCAGVLYIASFLLAPAGLLRRFWPVRTHLRA